MPLFSSWNQPGFSADLKLLWSMHNNLQYTSSTLITISFPCKGRFALSTVDFVWYSYVGSGNNLGPAERNIANIWSPNSHINRMLSKKIYCILLFNLSNIYILLQQQTSKMPVLRVGLQNSIVITTGQTSLFNWRDRMQESPCCVSQLLWNSMMGFQISTFQIRIWVTVKVCLKPFYP